VHWCLGLRGSGSTWLFNAVRKIALALAPDRPVLGAFVLRHDSLPALDDIAHQVVVKSHATDDAAATELSEHAQAIWISIRDPRDCVTSLVQYHDWKFDVALGKVEQDARFCARFATDPRAHLLRYEAGFTDDPATLDRIAAGFGGTLSVSDHARIFAETRRAAIEALIAQFPTLPTAVHATADKILDTETHWYNHHANRTGENGRWRNILTRPQAIAIEQQLGNWMNAFDYHTELVG
jgi:hypothetical protein